MSKIPSEWTSLGARIKWLRDREKQTLERFAQRLLVSAGYVSKLERDLEDNPSQRVLDKITSTFGVSINWLLTGEGEPSSPRQEIDPHEAARDFFQSNIVEPRQVQGGTWVLEVRPKSSEEKGLSVVNLSVNNPPVETWDQLRHKLIKATEPRGKMTELAAKLEVSLSQVSQWLSGTKEPGGDYAIRMLHWVEHPDRKTKNP